MRRLPIAWVVVGLMLTGCPDDDDDDLDAGRSDGGSDGIIQPDGGRPDGGRPDGSSGDMEVDAAPGSDAALPPPDGGPRAPDPETAPPPLFDPAGGTPADQALAKLVDVWVARPTDEASAQMQTQEAQESRRQLAELGPVAADRAVEKCRPVPLEATRDQLICLRLLSLVESAGSLEFLFEKARLAVPPWPEGAHPHDPPPEGLARQVATWALGQRAKAGSQGALDLLLRLVGDAQNPNRSQAVQMVYGALPRIRAKARMRALLAPEDLYLLYEVR